MAAAPVEAAAAAALSVELADVEATEALGAALAHEVQRGDVIFLRGELGSGKTSLARGFLRRFFGNPLLDVPSPSYLLHFAYSSDDAAPQEVAAAVAAPAAEGGKATMQACRVSSSSLVPGCPVHHIDPFRLPEGKIAALVDFEAIFGAISLIEWPERLGDQLVSGDKPPRLEVNFEGFGPQGEGRIVTFSAVGDRWRGTLDRWAAEGGPLRSRPSDPAPSASLSPSPAGDGQASASTTPAAASTRNCRALPADPRKWRVLGIESSCDDTGAAVLSGTGEILGEALASQSGIHEQWGGVVPRLAQDGHRKAIDATVEEALERAGVAAAELTAVAVTVGPGLGMCLEVGVRKALQIAAAHRLPVIRVHHMEAHMLVTRLPSADVAKAAAESADGVLPALSPAFPFLTLLVSGGHNMAVLSRGIGNHTILGSTIDDSIGEAFDKTARTLGITQVPGGPHLERLAKEGDADLHKLPKPLSKSRDPALQKGCDFSFSGLKTAVRALIDKEIPAAKVKEMSEPDLRQARAHIAAAFQNVAVRHLCERAGRAAEWAVEMEPETASMVVAGGVAANQAVRQGLREVAEDCDLEMRCPPPRLCVDNGVMVAWAGVERLKLGLYEEPPSEAGTEHAVEIRPRWPLGNRDPRSQRPAPPKLPKGQKRKKEVDTAGGDAAVEAAARKKTAA
mmetsp:Transcript_156378/g.501665  ORF Transcript_156378/g.501665 Transcript_156378/m.501665 type:complete len:680 (-) Transcript_156378:65-2104(-)